MTRLEIRVPGVEITILTKSFANNDLYNYSELIIYFPNQLHAIHLCIIIHYFLKISTSIICMHIIIRDFVLIFCKHVDLVNLKLMSALRKYAACC